MKIDRILAKKSAETTPDAICREHEIDVETFSHMDEARDKLYVCDFHMCQINKMKGLPQPLVSPFEDRNSPNVVASVSVRWHCAVLDFSLNHISKIQGLDGGLPLRKLDLSSNQIECMQNLEALDELQVLNLSNNCVTEVQGLSGCLSLQKLDLSQNRIPNLLGEGLEGIARLVDLDLSGNLLKSLSGIRALHGTLARLNVQCNQLTEIDELVFMKRLEVR
jgi:hypothetical protein